MGKVLYEVSYQFDFACLIPFVMLIAGCCVLKSRIGKRKIYGKKHGDTSTFVLLGVYLFFVTAVAVLTIVTGVQKYDQVIGAYKKGNYQTVEGFVENYETMPYEGHAQESFTINGVEFSYSDYTVMQGYHNAASHGGVITHNGQYLKLRYVTNELNENIIVYIEELP